MFRIFKSNTSKYEDRALAAVLFAWTLLLDGLWQCLSTGELGNRRVVIYVVFVTFSKHTTVRTYQAPFFVCVLSTCFCHKGLAAIKKNEWKKAAHHNEASVVTTIN